MKTVLVIIPVYKGLEETRACIESAIAAIPYNQIAQKILIINDQSPESELVSYLHTLSSPHIEVVDNDTNLGFVGTVNYGMQQRNGNDVILLNSDTEVYGNWVDRLAQTAYAKPEIATVTPYSNNATLCSFPINGKDNELPFGLSAQQLDDIFSQTEEELYFEIPTGVGFCFYIKSAALDDIGLFNQEVFGKGYGEENDFCLRAIAKGWLNVLCANVFVYHKGNVSFQDDSNPKKLNAQKIINQMYPDYHQMIVAHFQKDPNKQNRLHLLLNIIRQIALPKILAVHHGLGGGVLRHVNELGDFFNQQAITLTLYPYHQHGITILELAGVIKLKFELPNDYTKLTDLLLKLQIHLVHFHHFMEVDESIYHLPTALNCPYDITLHDFYTINGNPTQCVEDRYLGQLPSHERDKLSLSYRPLPKGMTLESWQAQFKQLFNSARFVLTPSQDTADYFSKEYPSISFIAAYPPEYLKLPVRQTDTVHTPIKNNLHVVVIGALSLEKGLRILEKTAQIAHQRQYPIKFSLLGYGAYPLTHVNVTGPYQDNESLELLHELNPDLIWFPAQSPETYCYTLSTALSTKKPIVAPKIGAFTERLAEVADGYLVDNSTTPEQWIQWFNNFRTQAPNSEKVEKNSIPKKASSTFFTTRYLVGLIKPTDTQPLSADTWENYGLSMSLPVQYSFKIKLLKLLIGFRQTTTGKMIARVLPLSFQTFIKRKLSRQPLHEIL